MTLIQFINYFLALFVVCNPIGALPALINLTEQETSEERRKTSLVTTLTIGIILISVTWIGSPFLYVLGIKVAPFQVAGGFVVFLLALSMLNAERSRIKGTKEETREAQIKESVGVTPLGMPLIAGPGAISTVIINSNIHPGFTNTLYMTFCALLVTLFMGVILFYADTLERILGRVGINIFTRIGGLILAANAVESLGSGLRDMFPMLGS